MAPLITVQSSMIQAHGYDAAQRVLAIRFIKSPYVHHFQDVPPETVAAVTEAKSIGMAFNEHVRGKFEHTTVKADDDRAEADHEAQ